MKNIVICPICLNLLEERDKSLICVNNHCFDISKEGYVNLLNIKDKKSLNPGDNQEMIQARQDFLNGGYYNQLCDKICEICTKTQHDVILECGAGEGFYISQIAENLKDSNCYAIDISKSATKKCAKRNKQVKTFVASSYSLPFKNESFDILLVCFAPYCEKEFARVLKEDGILIIVKPDRNHLKQMKEILFDEEEREKNNYIYNQFNLFDIEKLKYDFEIKSKKDILNLFQMTPYYYKSKKENAEKLISLENLTLTADFEILILKKR